MRRFSPVLLLCPSLLLAGCSDFFPKPTNTGGGGGTGSSTDLVFALNAGANSISGFGISTTGTLSSLNGSPISLSTTPTALTVSRNNAFLWVGTPTQIFAYSIGSGGALTAVSGGAAIANANCVDMQTTPDGKWLMVLDGTGNSIDLFAINSDGTLSAASGAGFTANGTVVPRQLRISNSGTTVIAAMGTGGELVFNFNTTTGAYNLLSQTAPPNLTSDNGIAIDSTGSYLYVARSGSGTGLAVMRINSDGTLTATTSAAYGAGTQPFAVTLDNTGKYAYVANRGDGTISGFGIGINAALTTLGGSPFSSGLAVTSLGSDSSGSWILAASFSGSPDLSLYGFDASNPGRLYTVSSTATGTNASLVALSH
jgi:6-phosphogluconolactonase (cycloisomerase 2 family)